MKPKDLKALFTFDNRKLLIEDGVFYQPDYLSDYKSFSFPDWQKIFNNDLPVALEFCAGNGAWIQERAEADKKRNWVAIEKRFDRIRKIWAKKKNHNLENLFAVCGEGHTFATHYVKEQSVSEVYINFPDPWPKKKHAKHRIMKESFIKELARILKRGGALHFVTDDKEYLEATKALVAENALFRQIALVEDPQDYGASYFSALWKEKGRTIYYAHYCTR